MGRFKEGCPGGMTEEQDKIYYGMEDRGAAFEFYKKCQKENLTDEYKEKIGSGQGDAGGMFPKFSILFDENRKMVMKNGKPVTIKHDPEDF